MFLVRIQLFYILLTFKVCVILQRKIKIYDEYTREFMQR